jgi:outer membrane protein OmpA-like peptidoglycan-associated protein
MTKRIYGTLALMLAAYVSSARANICGTDFQNFNPTSSGIDFVTVHSSETLKPCILNMGLFVNHAANTLTYAGGNKQNDRITGADLSAGVGLTQNWDMGVGLPFILEQTVGDYNGATAFTKRGLNEVKLNTKYRFSGDDSHGYAAVLSFNFNTIQNNPFAGAGAGPTTNFELVADTTLGSWALAANAGYRWRQPGSRIPNQPYEPLRDQFIYSAAASYLIKNYDSKVIFEIVGSQAAKSSNYDTDRSLNALEWIGGVKHDISHNIAFHVGGGTGIGKALGSPDWRVYTGLNWTFGPICDTSPGIQKVREGDHDVYTFNAGVLFAHDKSEIRDATITGDIDKLMTELNRTGFSRISIEGHTDSVGSVIYNLNLSQRRAESVKRYVIQKYHVPENKITTAGFGPSRPIGDNGNFQGRQQNRRVEFKVWK